MEGDKIVPQLKFNKKSHSSTSKRIQKIENSWMMSKHKSQKPKPTRGKQMPIDLLGAKPVPFREELARQALKIIRQPFRVRYLEEVKTVAISVAPVRIDTGGWSDCWWFLENHPGFVCNLALALYSYVVAVVFDRKGEVHYHALDLGAENSGPITEIERQFVHVARDNFPRAFDSRETHIIVNAMAPPKAGLGSSGSVGVSIVALLAHLAQEMKTREELAYLAHRIEHFDLKSESGIQDQVVAALGSGCIEMFEGDFPRFEWRALQFLLGMVDAAEAGLLLVDTGEGRSSAEEHERKIAMIRAGGPEADEALGHIISIAEAARMAAQAFESGNWPGFCEAVGENWSHQVALDSSAETERIRRITNVARRHGAFVKGWGAAGGGVMGVLCPEGRLQRDKIATSLLEGYLPEMGGAGIIPTALAPRGVEVCSFTGDEFRRLTA